MSFPRYPEYKDSGVEWLGEVPSHWYVSALKRGYDVILGKMLQPEPKKESDQFLPYLRAANIQPKGVDLSDVRNMWFSPAEARQLELEHGDLLISEGGDVGRPALWANGTGYHIQNSINRVRPNDGNSSRFLFYWMLAIKQKGYVDVLCNKSTIAHFTAEKVAAVPTPFPPGREQSKIAAFLDHETARIDALVEQQQRLIALLKEKRQAVISQAVTKGLDPDVSMQDSGLEWLGEVPAHWSLPKKLDHIALDESNSFVNGPFGSDLLASELKSSGVPVIYIRDLKINGYARISEQFVTQEKAKQIAFCNVFPGDVLVAKVGDPPGLAVTYPENKPNGVITQDVIRIRPSADRADPRFLAYVINSDAGRYAIDQISVVSTRTRVSLGDFKQLRFCWPPVDEQERISDFLDYELASISRLINEAYKVVKLLAERRSALISAAVTGKIDVRGWHAPAGLAALNESAHSEVV